MSATNEFSFTPSMNQHPHQTSKSSLMSMMMSTTSKNSDSIFSSKMFSDIDLTEHLDNPTQQDEPLSRSKMFNSSVSSSVFLRFVDDADSNQTGKGRSSGKSQTQHSTADEPSASLLLSSTAIESCEDLPEHDLDADLMASMMMSFQKTMSISSHNTTETPDDGTAHFQLVDDCNPRPIQPKKAQKVQPKSKKARSSAPFSIPSFQKTNIAHDEENLEESRSSRVSTPCALTIATSASPVAPTLVTPTSIECAPVVQSVEPKLVVPSPSPAQSDDGPCVLQHYPRSINPTPTLVTVSHSGGVDSLPLQEACGPWGPRPTETPDDGTAYFQLVDNFNPQPIAQSGLEMQYMQAVERLQQSMARSKVTRSAVSSSDHYPGVRISSASANTGALLRQHAARHSPALQTTSAPVAPTASTPTGMYEQQPHAFS